MVVIILPPYLHKTNSDVAALLNNLIINLKVMASVSIRLLCLKRHVQPEKLLSVREKL